MISQTLSNQVLERSLLPNGPIVQLGTFEGILSEFSGSCKLTCGFELSFYEEHRDVPLASYELVDYKVVVTFGSANGDSGSPSAIEASKVVVEGVSLEMDLELGSLVESEEVGREISDAFKGSFVVKKIPDNELERFWESLEKEHPNRFPVYRGERPNHLGEFILYNGASSKVLPEQFLVTLSHFLPTYLARKPKGKAEELSGFPPILLETPAG